MSYYLAPALARLRDEVNAKWPRRSKRSDGWIGDPAHRRRKSDHNPNSRGSVNAIDITADGIDTAALIAAAKKHPSVRYIIHDKKIMNRDIGNFKERPYTKGNPHTTHVHISIYQSRTAEQRTQSWGLSKAAAKPKQKPKPAAKKSAGSAPPFPLRAGRYFGPEGWGPNSVSGYHGHRADLRRWQQKMWHRGWRHMLVDGWFGKRGQKNPADSRTGKIARQFQQEKGLAVDGLVGPETWRAAWEEPVT